jgi:hypothetical protein
LTLTIFPSSIIKGLAGFLQMSQAPCWGSLGQAPGSRRKICL